MNSFSATMLRKNEESESEHGGEAGSRSEGERADAETTRSTRRTVPSMESRRMRGVDNSAAPGSWLSRRSVSEAETIQPPRQDVHTGNVDTETDDVAAAQQNDGVGRVNQHGFDEAAVPGGESRTVTLVPDAVQVLGLDGTNPLNDLAGSDDEESPREAAVQPMAQPVDREEEERKMKERVTRRVQERMIRDAPIANVITSEENDLERDAAECSPRGRRRLVVGGIVFVVLAIGIGVSLGMTLPREKPSRTLDELLSSFSFDGGEALRTPSTPQNMAFKWLANNTNLGTYTDQRLLQRYTLATLYFSTNGSDWIVNTNWLDDEDECGRWAQSNGLPLLCTGDRVTQLTLDSNNLIGSIPPEIGLLSSSLVHLGLFKNTLMGCIPSEMGTLTKLTALGLYQNLFNETIPTQLGLLENLDIISLWGNQLTGTIPPELGKLTKLTALSVAINKLTGMIPSTFNRLTNLDTLELFDNMLTGTFTCPEYIESCVVSCSFYDDADCRSLP